MFSVQVKLFSNSFDPQLVDSVAMELTDVEGWLRILLYVLRQKKKKKQYIVGEILKHSGCRSVPRL